MVTPKSNKEELYLTQSFQTTPFATYKSLSNKCLTKYRMAVSHGLFEDAYHMRISVECGFNGATYLVGILIGCMFAYHSHSKCRH